MFNNSGVNVIGYGAGKQILANVGVQVAVGVLVDDAAGSNVGTKKIVEAGTPLKGDLEDLNTAFVAADDTNGATGVLLHDLDVTGGDNNGTLLIFGFVNTNRLSDDVKDLLTDDVKGALDGKVTFLAM